MLERRKPEYPEKNLSEQRREPSTNSTHIWRRRRIWTRATLVGSERSHHCATLAPRKKWFSLPHSATTWTEICLETVSIPENHVPCRGENQRLCGFFVKMYSHYQSLLTQRWQSKSNQLWVFCRFYAKFSVNRHISQKSFLDNSAQWQHYWVKYWPCKIYGYRPAKLPDFTNSEVFKPKR